MGVAQAIGIIVLLAVIFYQGSKISSYKSMYRGAEQSYNAIQLEVVSLETALNSATVEIAELEDEAKIYLSTLQDMKAYNADLETKIETLNNDVQTSEFMINDLETELNKINERLKAQESNTQ
jgi:chromosome segregation ATPase